MPGSMIQDQPSHQLGIAGQLVNHMHDLNHVQVYRFVCDPNDVDCVYNDVNQLIGQLMVKLRAKCCPCHADQQRFFNSIL